VRLRPVIWQSGPSGDDPSQGAGTQMGLQTSDHVAKNVMQLCEK